MHAPAAMLDVRRARARVRVPLRAEARCRRSPWRAGRCGERWSGPPLLLNANRYASNPSGPLSAEGPTPTEAAKAKTTGTSDQAM